MAELLRVEPSKFCAGEAWFIFDDGRQMLRKVDRPANDCRSDFPAPMIKRDTIDECQSQADGKYYTSLSALRRSYRADGNPQGVNYTEIGDQEAPTITYDFDRKTRRDDIKAAIEDVRNGRVAPIPPGPPA